jgi:hypothetical protein
MRFLLLKKTNMFRKTKNNCFQQFSTISISQQCEGKNHFGNEESIQGHRARIGAPHHAWGPSTAKLTGGSHVSAEFYYQKPSDS